MPLFHYTATNQAGKNVDGYIDAGSKPEAHAQLKKKSLYPLKLERANLKHGVSQIKADEQLSHSMSQLGAMLDAGITMDEALESLGGLTEDPKLATAFIQLRSSLREGGSLSRAIRTTGGFPVVLEKMVEAGEESGKPAELLSRYAEYLEADIQHRQALVSALAYPIALVVVAVFVILGIMVYLIPVITTMYDQLGVDPPFITQIFAAFGVFLKKFGPWILSVGILLAVAFRLMTTEQYRNRIWLSLPVIGSMIQMGLMEKWSRTLATLQDAGLPLLRSLALTRESTGNAALDEDLRFVESGVEKGRSLSDMLQSCHYFSPFLIQYVRTGEQTGNLEGMLNRAADFFEKELERKRKIVVGVLEPALILIMGVLILIIVLSVLLPLSEMTANLQQV